MQSGTSSVWVLGLGALSVILLAAVWQCTKRGSQMPFWLFICVYFITTFLGGLSIGLQGLNHLESIVEGINLTVLYDIGSAKYWCILYGPLIVLPACVLILNLDNRTANHATRIRQRPAGRRRIGPPRIQRISVLAFMLVVVLFGGYAVFQLYRNEFLYAINLWQSEQGNYGTLMTFRSEMFLSLGAGYFIVAYSVMPTLCSYALYEAVKSRSLLWQTALAITFALSAFLTLSTLQKAYLLVVFLSLGIGLVTLRVIKMRSFWIFVACSFGLLTFMQTFLIGKWYLLDTAQHLVYRMAHAYPYYLNVYPTHLPFEGVYLGLNLFGIGEPSQISANVMPFIYANLGPDLAHAPAAAHIDAYAQGGVVYSFAMLTGIGVMLGIIGGLRLGNRGPIAFALYIQLLVFAYCLTQASFVTSVIGAYGIAWPMAALLPIWFMQKFVSRYAHRPGSRRTSPFPAVDTSLLRQRMATTSALRPSRELPARLSPKADAR